MASVRGYLEYAERTLFSIDPDFRDLQNAATFAQAKEDLTSELGAIHQSRRALGEARGLSKYKDERKRLSDLDDVAYDLYEMIWNLDRPPTDISPLKTQLLAFRGAVTKRVDSMGDMVVGEKAWAAGRRHKTRKHRKRTTRRRRHGFAY